MLSPSSMLLAASPRRGPRDEIMVESYLPNLAGKRQTRWQVSPPEQEVLDAAYDRDPFPPSEIRSALPRTIAPLTPLILHSHHPSLSRTFHSPHPPITGGRGARRARPDRARETVSIAYSSASI